MTDVERALEYLKIFINVGDRWKSYVPVESVGLVTESSVRIDGFEMGPDGPDQWWLKDLGTGLVRRYKRSVSS